MNAYEVLGRQAVDEMVRQMQLSDVDGDDFEVVGDFNWGALINAGAEVANQGVAYKQQQDATNKAKSDAAAAAQRSISADVNWANAEAQLDLANQSKDPARIGPAQALQMQAMQQAQAAGAVLTPDAQAQRVTAAQKAAADAAQAALQAPGDQLKQAMSRAWQKVQLGSASAVTAALAPNSPADAGKRGGKHEASWWTPGHIGLVVGGTAAAVGVGILIIKLLKK